MFLMRFARVLAVILFYLMSLCDQDSSSANLDSSRARPDVEVIEIE